MYELFYNFLIEELIVKYFKQNNIEPGDRYYIKIEDSTLRKEFFKALCVSAYTQSFSLRFKVPDKYGEVENHPYETVLFDCSKNGTKVLVSDCDNVKEGFQAYIRNAVTTTGNPVSNMAVFFILPGSNTIDTLDAGHNLQEAPYPLSMESVVAAIRTKTDKVINDVEKAYLKNHINGLKLNDDYRAIFGFASILSILQKSSIKDSYHELGAFEDSEIYDSLFAITNISDRVKDNTEAFGIVSDIMGEPYEQDQYKRLCTYLDPKLARKIVYGDINWKKLDYKTIRKSHEDNQANATLKKPVVLAPQNVDLVVHTTGNDKKSTTYVLCCCPKGVDEQLKFEFNKDIRDLYQGNNSVSGRRLTIPSGIETCEDEVGTEKNLHKIKVLRITSSNIFKGLENNISLKKDRIIIEIVESDSVTLGSGTNEVTYDNISPVEIDDSSYFMVEVDRNSTEIPIIPFKFGDKVISIEFKYKIEKTPTLPPSSIIEDIWGDDNGGFTISEGEDSGTITGPIIGTNGPVFVHERFRRCLSIEKSMIEEKANHLVSETSDIGDSIFETYDSVEVPCTIKDALLKIYSYFQERNTLPSLHRPTAELIELYKEYISAVHQAIDSIPTSEGLSSESKSLAKLGVWEREDGSVALTPFHPLMVAYGVQMAESISADEFNKKVLAELSPMSLMPFIYYGADPLKAINAVEIEGLKTWCIYDKADDPTHNVGSKSTTKQVAEKIKNFISNFKYYFPDSDCPIVVSAIGLEKSVDLVRGIVQFIATESKSGEVQRIEIHEYVEDILQETFYECLNRQATRDRISVVFEENNFDIDDSILNDIIRLLFERVRYFKHSLKENRCMTEYSHIAFYRFDYGSKYSPLPANKLRTEAALDGLVSIASTNLSSDGQYLMGYGTKGLKPNDSVIYRMADDYNSLYAGLQNGGLSTYSRNQCTAKIYSFADQDFLNTIYDNSTWVTFINPEVETDFFYRPSLYVVHYVEQRPITAKLESITVTNHIEQYNNMLFNSLQTFKAVIGTSEDFSRKMISYFNCLNGRWLLDIIDKPELIVREKMSLVATCFVMSHFLTRTDGYHWVPIALDDIIRATGSTGLKSDSLFSKKDLGIEGPLSDDILMMGIKNNGVNVEAVFYPVEVKVLADGVTEKASIQVASLYSKVLKDHLFNGDSFTRRVYRAMFASHYLSNAEKMKANGLMYESEYNEIDSYRYELLNVKFKINEELPKELGKAAVVVYSNATAKSINTEYIEGVPICHINMMESDCYKLVANPDSQILNFVTSSSIGTAISTIASGPGSPISVDASMTPTLFDAIEPELVKKADDEEIKAETAITTEDLELIPSGMDNSAPKHEETGIKIVVGTNRKGVPVVFEPNNTSKVSYPNMGIIGSMGYGKTQIALSVIAQLAKETEHNVAKTPVGVLVFDYKGDDYSTEAFLKQVNGKCYSHNFPFNPLKLIVTDKTGFMNLPAVTADRISDSFAKAYGLGQVQQSTIKQVILDTYAQFGITREASTWTRKMPTMSDVVDMYFSQYDAKDKAYALFDKLRDYTIFTTDNSACVSLFEWLDGVKVIDLTPYPSDTKKVIVSLILDLFYEEMRQLGHSRLEGEYRELRAMILVDEAHQFMNKDFNSFRNIISEGRAFGVGMILSTQNLSDFKSPKLEYNTFVLSWVIHHVNNLSKSDIANIFGSNDSNGQAYMQVVSNARKFECLCKLADKVYQMRTLPYFELKEKDKRFSSGDESTLFPDL